MTCKTYLQTFHVILMRFTNHKITKSQITKSQKVFAIIIKKILYNLLIYYIYYNIYNILLFILVISLLPFLFSFCDFVILWFVILWQCTMKAHGVRSAVRTILIIHLQPCNLQLCNLQMSTGDKSGKRPQNMSCYNEYFIIFL